MHAVNNELLREMSIDTGRVDFEKTVGHEREVVNCNNNNKKLIKIN